MQCHSKDILLLYCDITITYSICVWYSHATVDLILMHGCGTKQYEALERTCSPCILRHIALLTHLLIQYRQTISKLHLSIKYWNLLEQLQLYMQNTYPCSYIATLQIGEKMIPSFKFRRLHGDMIMFH